MTKTFLKSLAVLGALAISTSAYASTVSVTYQGSGPFTGPVATGHINGLTVDSKANPDKTVNANVGAFSLNGDLDGSGAANFIAFCVDIVQTLVKGPVTYTLGDLTDLTSNATRQSNIQKLFNTAYSTLDIGNNVQSAGFQMALWELLYEKVGKEGNLNAAYNENFSVTGSGSPNQGAAARSFATSLIANLDGDQTADYDLAFLSSATHQNLLTAKLAATPPAPVPVPAAGLLLLAGLAGLGAMARRRKDA